MFDKSHDIKVLNSLIETMLDSADGYRRAAEEAQSSRFASDFMQRAGEREQLVSKLQEEVRRLGGTPEDNGSVLAAAHRQFLTIRDKITGGDDESVIAEVDHGETYLKEKWEAALRDDELSPETRNVISQCYENVRARQQEWRAAHKGMAATS